MWDPECVRSSPATYMNVQEQLEAAPGELRAPQWQLKPDLPKLGHGEEGTVLREIHALLGEQLKAKKTLQQHSGTSYQHVDNCNAPLRGVVFFAMDSFIWQFCIREFSSCEMSEILSMPGALVYSELQCVCLRSFKKEIWPTHCIWF